MSTQLLIGIIDDGEWRVAQRYKMYEDDELYNQASIILDRLKYYADTICDNLHHCKFVVLFNDMSEEKEEEISTLSVFKGAAIIDDIIDCPKYQEILLHDARNFIKDELYCRYSFIINFDTRTLSAYHCGDKFLCGTYDLNNLPRVDSMMEDLARSESENQREAHRIICAPILKMIRENAVSEGKDPNEAEENFLNELSTCQDEK